MTKTKKYTFWELTGTSKGIQVADRVFKICDRKNLSDDRCRGLNRVFYNKKPRTMGEWKKLISKVGRSISNRKYYDTMFQLRSTE